MKILFLNTFSTVHGGVERMLFDTSAELLDRGHEVSMVIAHDDRRVPNPQAWPSAINRYYIPELIVPMVDRRHYDRFRRSRAYQEAVRYFQDIVDIELPDVVHVHNFPSFEVLTDIRILVPVVRTIHSFENLCRNHLKRLPDGAICAHPMGRACEEICGMADSFKAIRVRVENAFMKIRVDRLVTVSDYMRGVLVANGFPAGKIEVLPNFTRLDEPLMDVAEEDAVLFVGRFTPEKGLSELLDAIGRTVSKPKLIVVGKDGVLGQSAFQDEIQRRARDLGLEVEFHGWLVGDDLRCAYARARIVAVSSVWPEPFGLVGIEAMAQGKPVVAFDSGGIRQWLDDGRTGYAVPHGDLDAFAARIDELMGDEDARRRMGQAARADALGYFTPDVHTNRLLGIYEEVLDESAADRPGRSAEIRHAQCGVGISV